VIDADSTFFSAPEESIDEPYFNYTLIQETMEPMTECIKNASLSIVPILIDKYVPTDMKVPATNAYNCILTQPDMPMCFLKLLFSLLTAIQVSN